MKKRQAAALLMVVTLTSLLLLTAFAASVNAVSDMKLTKDEVIKNTLEMAALSGIKRAKAKIETSFNNNNLTVLQPDVLFQGSSIDDTGLTPEEKSYGDETFVSGVSADYYSYKYQSNFLNDEITVMYTILEADDWVKTQNYTTYTMDVEVVAFIPDKGWVGMQEQVSARRTTLFMYQVFFENDLEVLPGPNFNLKGLIHTNEDLYLNANNTLNIYTDSITSAGNAYRGRLDSSQVSGTVRITNEDEDGALVTMYSSDDSDNDDWETIAAENWAGTLRDQNLGASRLEAPSLKSFQKNGYYYNQSDLRIEVLAAGKTTKKTQYDVTYNGTTTRYTQSQLGGAISETQIYDGREQQNVSLTQVDVQKLSQVVGTPSNGIIYMTRDDAIPDSDGNEYSADYSRNVSGFKLVNGETLPDAMTFVSDLPTYIQGDFNLHTDSDPASDSWKPCAVVSDAITLLSNSWSDSISGVPSASDTSYNTVFITGNTPSKYGQYSGGLENFPRFLENWSGKDTNIKGGFIQLFRSSYATGLWNGNYYDPPTRNWGSEDRFSSLLDLPPGYADIFPSTSLGIVYSSWSKIAKDDSVLDDEI